MSCCKSYTLDQLNHLTTTNDLHVSVLNVNIRSLRKNFDKLEAFLDSLNFSFDLICLTETFVDEHEARFFALDNYMFLGQPRNSRGGGVGVFVRRTLEAGREHLAVAGAEALLFTVVGAGWASPYKITVLYRQPSAGLGDFLESLEEHLFASGNPPHIILGDFNIDTSHTSCNHDYLNLISSFNFTNTITIPTRISPQKSSIIDHILINFDVDYSSGTVYTDISDHLPSFFLAHLALSAAPAPSEIPSTFQVIDKPRCIALIEELDWNYLYDLDSVEDMSSVFSTKLKEAIDACTETRPLTRQPRSRGNLKPWITPLLKRKIKTKNRLFRMVCDSPLNTKLRTKYVSLRNTLTKELKAAKLDYYTETFNSFRNSSEMWKFLKTVNGFRNNKNSDNQISELFDPVTNTNVSGPAVADILNRHFSTIGETLASKFTDTAVPPVPHLCGGSPPASFSLQPVAVEQVFDLLNKLDTKKATGLDAIPAWLLKLCSSTLANPLTHIFNKSLTTGLVPTLYKKAKVIPLFKKGDPHLASNYRPISILPVVSKIFEKLVNNQILNYLETNNLLTPSQYGFRKNKSTRDAIVEFTNDSLMALNDGMCVLGVFIDFAKAFDTIDHTILLDKLKKLGLNSQALNWFSSYFDGRSQLVIMGNYMSNPCKLSVGVPQGSILGPTLFLIYINDLCSSLKHCKPILYADDTNLFYKHTNLSLELPKINEDLQLLKTWCHNNKLTLNLDKTCYILIKNRQNPFHLPQDSIRLDDTALAESKNIKFLGITVDQNLSFKTHIANLVVKIRPYIGLLYRCAPFLPRPILLLIYNSYINSALSYCVEAYGTANVTTLHQLFILQKRIVRIISSVPFYSHTASLFSTLNILSIYKLFKFRSLLTSHATFYRSQSEISNMESHLHHTHFTRSSQLNLPLPASTSLAGHRSPIYQAPALWNSLPANLRKLKSTLEFRRALRQHLLQ